MMKSILFENNPITIYLIMTMAQIKLNLLIGSSNLDFKSTWVVR